VKRRQAIGALFIAALMLLFLGAPALAQGFENLPPTLAAVISKTGVFVNQILNNLVSGNDLTPQGVELVDAIAKSVVNTVHFFAQIVTLF
jgi:hypothetical protein